MRVPGGVEGGCCFWPASMVGAKAGGEVGGRGQGRSSPTQPRIGLLPSLDGKNIIRIRHEHLLNWDGKRPKETKTKTKSKSKSNCKKNPKRSIYPRVRTSLAAPLPSRYVDSSAIPRTNQIEQKATPLVHPAQAHSLSLKLRRVRSTTTPATKNGESPEHDPQKATGKSQWQPSSRAPAPPRPAASVPAATSPGAATWSPSSRRRRPPAPGRRCRRRGRWSGRRGRARRRCPGSSERSSPSSRSTPSWSSPPGRSSSGIIKQTEMKSFVLRTRSCSCSWRWRRCVAAVQDGGEVERPVEGDDEAGAGVRRVRGVRQDTRPQPRLPWLYVTPFISFCFQDIFSVNYFSHVIKFTWSLLKMNRFQIV